MTRIAIINKEKCKPTLCNHECKRYCPVEKKELDSCITIQEKATINEDTCIGCGICEKRCPFDAITILNVPSIKEEDLVHRYGINSFALYGLPTPKKGSVLGLLGKNGIGKSTAIRLLSNQEQMNLGKKEATQEQRKSFLKGTELMTYFEELKQKRIAYKPQNLSTLAKDLPVIALLEKFASHETITHEAKRLNIDHILNNTLVKLSGGELQRVAILAATLKDADCYFFDEPLAYLDIGERLRVSDYIKETVEDKTAIIIDHDLLILDYLTDYVNIFFGAPGAFGLVSQLRATKQGVNTYLSGILKEENIRMRDKPITFNFTKNPPLAGRKVGSWPAFTKTFAEGFTLNVKEGEIHENHVIGILGKNGTGKSTFVKCLSGEETVTIEGKEEQLNLGLKQSYKPQYLFTDSEELVRDIIIKEKINKRMITTFNLAILQTKRMHELSGGELQRVAVARCLARDADIYLLDEPSAYLDVEERITVAKAIKEIMTEKEKTAFVIDHDLLLISYLADAVINANGNPGKEGHISTIQDFESGITSLLQSLDITLRKDKESGRPRINKKGSVLDREQKEQKEWVIL